MYFILIGPYRYLRFIHNFGCSSSVPIPFIIHCCFRGFYFCVRDGRVYLLHDTSWWPKLSLERSRVWRTLANVTFIYKREEKRRVNFFFFQKCKTVSWSLSNLFNLKEAVISHFVAAKWQQSLGEHWLTENSFVVIFATKPAMRNLFQVAWVVANV